MPKGALTTGLLCVSLGWYWQEGDQWEGVWEGEE